MASWLPASSAANGAGEQTHDLALHATHSPTASAWTNVGDIFPHHAQDIWACDFVQIYDLFFRSIFVVVLIEHHSRRVIHIWVTRSPSDRWVGQHLKEATAFGVAPTYLLHDNDGK
jgi:hypothetical protein